MQRQLWAYCLRLVVATCVVSCSSDTSAPFEWTFDEPREDLGYTEDMGIDSARLDVAPDISEMADAADLPRPDLGQPLPNPVTAPSCLQPSKRIWREWENAPSGLGVANRTGDAITWWSDHMMRFDPETNEWQRINSTIHDHGELRHTRGLVAPNEELTLVYLSKFPNRSTIRVVRYAPDLLADYNDYIQSFEGELSHVELVLDHEGHPFAAWSRSEGATRAIEYAFGEPDAERLRYYWFVGEYSVISSVSRIEIVSVGEEIWLAWLEEGTDGVEVWAMQATDHPAAELVQRVDSEVHSLHLHSLDGSLIASWTERSMGADSIVSSRRGPSTDWTTPAAISVEKIAEIESLELGDENLFVWLTDGDGASRVKSARFDGSNWSQIQTIAEDPGDRSLLRMDRLSGEAIALWVNRRDIGDTISAARFSRTEAFWSESARFDRALDRVVDLEIAGGEVLTAVWTHRVRTSPHSVSHGMRAKRCTPW